MRIKSSEQLVRCNVFNFSIFDKKDYDIKIFYLFNVFNFIETAKYQDES